VKLDQHDTSIEDKYLTFAALFWEGSSSLALPPMPVGPLSPYSALRSNSSVPHSRADAESTILQLSVFPFHLGASFDVLFLAILMVHSTSNQAFLIADHAILGHRVEDLGQQ
jgi:hypothetical protein